jgi:hypothetical protein
MTGLPEMLERAAGDGPVGFGSSDVAHRVERHARRQRVLVGAAVVLVLMGIGIAALAARAGTGSDTPLVDEPDARVTVGELSEAVWILDASDPRATDAQGTLSVAFHGDGRLFVVEGGCVEGGRWRVDGDLLVASTDDDPYAACLAETSALALVLDSPTIVRPDGPDGPMELHGGSGSLVLQRADRAGRTPSASDVVGTWSHPDIGPFELSADGTLTIGTEGCVEGTWALDGDRLTVDQHGTEEPGTCTFVRLTTDDDPLDGTSTVRIDGDRLVLATSQWALTLTR